MSGLAEVVAQVRNMQLRVESRGFRILAIYVGPDVETTLIAAAMRWPHTYVTLPELTLCGVRVMVHKKMPRGHMWFSCSGGLDDRKLRRIA